MSHRLCAPVVRLKRAVIQVRYLTTRSSGPWQASLQRAASAVQSLRRPRALGRSGRPLNASVRCPCSCASWLAATVSITGR